MLRHSLCIVGLVFCVLSARGAEAGVLPELMPLALSTASGDSLEWWGSEEFAAARDSIQLGPGQNRIALSRTLLLDPVVVKLGGRVLREGEEYHLDRARGRVVLVVPPTEAVSLVVDYRFDPLAAPARVQLHRMQREAASPDSVDVDLAAASEALSRSMAQDPSRQSLQVSGSKTLAVQGGTNREATVDQGLQLSVTGKLTETVQVRAEISDENLPITPEGNTEELSDIDQVRIEVFGPRGRALMGDFEIDQPLGVFVPYQRKLQGLWLHGRDPIGNGTLFGGTPRGKRIEVEARGQEGLQGPYELLDGLREDESFIVAGSERVWVDGQRQIRGENRDYTIDYIRGTITFTELRPVGPENRIAVDFEVSRVGYGRTVVGGLVDSTGWKALNLRAGWMREADDPARPVGGPLSAEDEEVLRNAGDDPDLALSSGITRVPEGEEGSGEYAERDSMGVTYYEFAVGEQDADYFLSFTRVDSGTGDYVQDGVDSEGRRIFLYVGPGAGDHLIGSRLALPSRTTAMVIGASVGGPSPEANGYLRAEGNFTDRDENLVSDLDDEDNEGAAWKAEAATPWLFGRGRPQGLRLEGLAESIDANFYELGRIRAPFFYDAWNLQDTERDRRESRQQVRLVAREGERRSDASLEALQREGRYDGKRARWAANGPLLGPFNWRHDLAWTNHEDKGEGSGDRRDRVARLGAKLGVLEPYVRWDDEEFQDGPAGDRRGYRGEEWAVGLLSEQALATGTLEYRRRLADSLDTSGTEWRFEQETRELRGGALGAKGAYRWNLDATYRESRFEDRPEETTRLGRLGLAWRPPAGRWGIDLDYRMGNDNSRVIQREVIFVGERQGDYDREGNRLGQNLGDYTVVDTPGDSLISATDVELGVKFDGEWMRAPLVWGFSFNGQYNVAERNDSDDYRGILTLDPEVLRDPDHTVFGEERIRVDLVFLRRLRSSNLRFVFDESETLDRRFTNRPDFGYRRERTLRLDRDLNRGWSLSLDGGDRRRVKQPDPSSINFLNTYDVSDLFGGAQLSYRPTARTRLSVDGRYTVRTDDFSGIDQDVAEIVPGLTTDLLRGRWTLEMRWAEVEEQNGDPLLRPFFFERPGTNRRLALAAQWALGKVLSVTVRYQLRDEPERSTVQDLSVETRARF